MKTELSRKDERIVIIKGQFETKFNDLYDKIKVLESHLPANVNNGADKPTE